MKYLYLKLIKRYINNIKMNNYNIKLLKENK